MIGPRIPIIFDTPRGLDYIQLLIATDMHNGSQQFDERKWDAFERLIVHPTIILRYWYPLVGGSN